MAVPLRAAVIHWQPNDLQDKVAHVRAAGAHVVVQEAEDGRRGRAALLHLRPDLIVVWMTWQPSHSRMLAGAVRFAAAGLAPPWHPTFLFVDDPDHPAPRDAVQALRSTVPEALVDVPSRLPFWVARVAAAKAAP